MKKIIIKAAAKLNLNLHILPQKIGQLYQVKFVNCQLERADELFFQETNYDIEIFCDNPQLSKKEDNLIYKAAVLFKKLINKPKLGAKITLKKNIPIKAGFGGGSSDAAATIKALMKLWNIELTNIQLSLLASSLGKDVYYCLKGGVCEVGGDGSKILRLNEKLPQLWLVIIIPEEQKPSTEWMYKNLKIETIGLHLNKLEKLRQAIKLKNREEIINNLFNDFEKTITTYFPIVKVIKNDIKKLGALNTIVAGSGLAVVGFFSNEKAQKIAGDKLTEKYNNLIFSKLH